MNKFLYSIYNYFRDMLVLNGYMCPFTGDITNTISKDLSAPMLWCSKGDHVKYPVEEIASEREEFFSGYKPYIPPVNLTDK